MDHDFTMGAAMLGNCKISSSNKGNTKSEKVWNIFIFFFKYMYCAKNKPWTHGNDNLSTRIECLKYEKNGIRTLDLCADPENFPPK